MKSRANPLFSQGRKDRNMSIVSDSIKTDDGEPAFPSRTETSLSRADGTKQTTMVEDGFRGMSLRDYFAAKALAAVVVRVELWDDTDQKTGGIDGPPDSARRA